MSKTTQRIVVLAFALALIIPTALVGLGGFGGGRTSPGSTPSNETTVAGAARDTRGPADPASQPRPTHTEPPNPADFADMNAPTEEGVRASVEHLFAVYAYMIGTGDTSQWQQLSAPECAECASFATQSAGLHAQGGWIVGGEITLTNQKVTLGTTQASDAGGAGQPSATLTATYHEAKATLIDDPTREAEVREPSTGTFRLQMRHDGTRWLVTSMTVS